MRFCIDRCHLAPLVVALLCCCARAQDPNLYVLDLAAPGDQGGGTHGDLRGPGGDAGVSCTGDGWCQGPAVAAGARLMGVWGSGAADVWIVGDLGTTLHYDGGGWSAVHSGSTSLLSAVWGSGAGDVWTVGEDGAILRYDGHTWTPGPSGHTYWGGIFGIQPQDMWLAGYQGLSHLTGPTIAPVDTGTMGNLNAIWGSGAGNIWAVGDKGVLAHLAGGAWGGDVAPVAADLFGVSGTGANNVWAVGSAGAILHFDGSGWTQVSGGAGRQLRGVWAGSAAGTGAGWAVGEGGALLKLSSTGAAMAVDSGTKSSLNGIWSSGGTGAIWAVGDGGTVLYHQ